MGVTDRGLRAWRHRPPSQRQRRDLILMAHIREQQRLCLGSYGRPRMTEELKALGLQVGQRRVGRLMRQNNIIVVRTRKFKRTTDSLVLPRFRSGLFESIICYQGDHICH